MQEIVSASCRNSFDVNEIEPRALTLKTATLSKCCRILDPKYDFFQVTDEEVEAAETVAEYEESSKAVTDADGSKSEAEDVVTI